MISCKIVSISKSELSHYNKNCSARRKEKKKNIDGISEEVVVHLNVIG